MNARHVVVGALARLDELLDGLLYRPAVVKAFSWLPRWWLCDLAKLSMRLDDRWQTEWWSDVGIFPGRPCEACGPRASIHVYGGLDDSDEALGDFLESRPVHLCGWCHLGEPVKSEEDLDRALASARTASISWRWSLPSERTSSDLPAR